MVDSVSDSKGRNEFAKLREIYDLQAERRSAFWNILFEERRCFEVARMRELSAWELLSGISVAAILAFASQMSKNRLLIIPIVPMVMWTGYRFDECFSRNASVIKTKAEEILNSEKGHDHVSLIGPPITLNELDERRQRKNALNNLNSVKKLKIFENI